MKLWKRILGALVLAAAVLLVGDFCLFLLEPTLVSIKDSIDARRAGIAPVALEPLGLDPGDTVAVPPPEDSFRFVALGHLRPLAVPRNHRLLRDLFTSVAAENPDVVFLLGDYTVDGNQMQWGILDDALARVSAPVYACPGNHEYARSWAIDRKTCFDRFQERLGRPHQLVQTPFAQFLVLNSCDSIPAIRTFLGTAYAALDPALPVILLTHHRIWMEPEPGRWFSTSFRPDEILPLLKGRVSLVLAGDDPLVPGTDTHQVSYATSRWEGIELMPVGIGDPGFGHPVTYAVGTVDAEGNVRVEVRHLPLPAGASWYSVRGHDAVVAFRALPFPRKVALYVWYLSHGRIPRGKVPLYGD